MTLLDELFDWTGFRHPELLDVTEPWEVLTRLPDYLAATARRRLRGEIHPTAIVDGEVTVGEGAVVGPYAIVRGPAILGDRCFVGRSLVRGALVADGGLVGHACEVAHSILLDGATVPHNTAAPDSVLGRGVNLGGGTMIGNLRLDGGPVSMVIGGERRNSGRTKLGALIGDGCQLGAACLLMPGTVLGRGCHVWPGAHLHGSYPPRQRIEVVQDQRVLAR